MGVPVLELVSKERMVMRKLDIPVSVLQLDGTSKPIEAYTLDLRSTVITNLTQFMEALYSARENYIREPSSIYLDVTQEWLLRQEAAQGLVDKDGKPVDPEKLSQLQSLMGYRVHVITGDED